jgi:hypothetical protein
MRADDLLYSTTVNLNFATSYWQFLSILYNLVQGDLGNRVVNYTLQVVPLDEEEFNSMRIEILGGPAAGYIPTGFDLFGGRQVNILQALMQPAAVTDPIGLHTLGVQMQVEYLSLEPGMLSEATMRALWELIDAFEPETEEYDY